MAAAHPATVERTAKLDRDPICAPWRQAGRLTLASTVDHDHAISPGGAAFPSLDGWQHVRAKPWCEDGAGRGSERHPFEEGPAWLQRGPQPDRSIAPMDWQVAQGRPA